MVLPYKKHLGKRYLANLIDYSLLIAAFVLLVFLLGEPNAEGGYTANGGAGILLMLLLGLGWFFMFPIAEGTSGQSPGKYMLGLIVTDNEGQPLGIKRAFLRRIVDFVELSTYGVASALTIAFTTDGKRIGDFIAASQVVSNQRECWHCGTTSLLSMEELVKQSYKCPECSERNSLRNEAIDQTIPELSPTAPFA